ncbi:DUF4190 domain-containing protein [Nocardioides sp. CN2-186]|uniref:DUF4190 domain-containing protein n=1 Tax=Nocardioides tweenelious TaxID=3156607 RepID=UPI0032B36D02
MTTHPRATRALWLGVVGLIGSPLFLPLFLGPFAWVAGARARREIASDPQRWGGRDLATAGMVVGIVDTVLLAITLLVGAGFLLLVVIFGVAASGSGH